MTATPANVRLITSLGDPPDDASIQIFIDTAVFITEVCTFSSELKEDRCNEYLASHLLASSPVGKAAAQIKSEKLEDVYSVTFATATITANSNDILSSEYGKTANMLSGGCIAELGKQPTSLLSIGSIGC